jgi:7,8-dihydropterin-6-yl-methyl-4-(beta-D-ribofuranosyl)aminobenzene 5'-phosphate synthase
MRVTALIENSKLEGRDDLDAEFGLSLHIEYGGRQILFDTGATGIIVRNAGALGIDLAEIDLAVLSHHHFDHGGGIEDFLQVNDRAVIHLRAGERVGRYFRAFAVIKRPIGLDLTLFDRFQDRFQEVTGFTEVESGVFLLTEIGQAHDRPKGNRHLFVEQDGTLVPDPFDHELMMVVHEVNGMVVFSGCSHHGILNMVDAAIEQFPGVPIKGVFGGFHLIGLPFLNTMAASRGEVEEIGRRILSVVAGTVYSGHCTGDKAFRVLKGVMGDTLQHFPTGSSVEV